MCPAVSPCRLHSPPGSSSSCPPCFLPAQSRQCLRPCPSCRQVSVQPAAGKAAARALAPWRRLMQSCRRVSGVCELPLSPSQRLTPRPPLHLPRSLQEALFQQRVPPKRLASGPGGPAVPAAPASGLPWVAGRGCRWALPAGSLPADRQGRQVGGGASHQGWEADRSASAAQRALQRGCAREHCPALAADPPGPASPLQPAPASHCRRCCHQCRCQLQLQKQRREEPRRSLWGCLRQGER